MSDKKHNKLTIQVPKDTEVIDKPLPSGPFLASVTYDGGSSTQASDSPRSTAATSVDGNIPTSPIVIATPPNFIMVGGKSYKSSELITMAELVAKARRTGELPNSNSSLEDADVIVQDYHFLAQLRATRGDPSADNPPSQEYHALRVEITRRIKDRDDDLNDDAVRAVAAQRVSNFKRVISQEERLLRAMQSVAQSRGAQKPAQIDMEEVTEELINAVENSISDATGPLRLNTNRINNTANTMESSMNVLNSSVNVVSAQINGLSAHVQGLGNLLRIQEILNERSGERVDGSIQGLSQCIDMITRHIQGTIDAIPGIVGQIVQEQIAQALTDALAAQCSVPTNEATKPIASPGAKVKKSSLKLFFQNIFKRDNAAETS